MKHAKDSPTRPLLREIVAAFHCNNITNVSLDEILWRDCVVVEQPGLLRCHCSPRRSIPRLVIAQFELGSHGCHRRAEERNRRAQHSWVAGPKSTERGPKSTQRGLCYPTFDPYISH